MEAKYERMMDFAERLCLKGGYPELTERRRQKLWGHVKGFLEMCVREGAKGYQCEPDDNGNLPCDLFHEHFMQFDVTDADLRRGKEENKFYSQLSAVCRAALDTLDGEGGVIGWTIGAIRQMYDGEIPDWFADQFLEPEKVREAKDEARIML